MLVPLENDLKSWTTLGSDGRTIKGGKIELFLKRQMFVSEIGEITGIAFLIFLAVSSIFVSFIQPTNLSFFNFSRTVRNFLSHHSGSFRLTIKLFLQHIRRKAVLNVQFFINKLKKFQIQSNKLRRKV